jgi:AraC-like DNA-binding protein
MRRPRDAALAAVLYTEYAPPLAAADAVMAIWRFRMAEHVVIVRPFVMWSDASASTVLPARGLVDPVISGPRSEPGDVPVRAGDETWGVKWWPDCGADAAGVTATQLVNTVRPASAAICAELAPVRDAIRREAGVITVRAMLDAWAVAHAAQLPARDQAVRHAIQRQTMSRGSEQIADSARAVGVSPRTLSRRFRSRVGLTPKAFARICRFRYALDRLAWAAEEAVASHAGGAGYADESHLVREFRTLSGIGPREVRRLLGQVASEAS